MSSYVDIESLRENVYFVEATLDTRFTWKEITPADPSVAEVMNGRWMDGLQRFRLTGCAHPESYREGARCTHCGHENPYEPPAVTTARKRRTTS